MTEGRFAARQAGEAPSPRGGVEAASRPPPLAVLALPYVAGVGVLAVRPDLDVSVFVVAVLGGLAATAVGWALRV